MTALGFADAARGNNSSWESRFQEFEKEDAEHPPQPGGIVFTGASDITRWKTLKEDFPNHRVVNRGFGGSQLGDLVEVFDRIIMPHRPRLIVLKAGGNDLASKRTPEQVAADFHTLVEKVHAALPGTRLIFLSANPSIKRFDRVEEVKKLNALIKAQCDQDPLLELVDTFPLFLNEKGEPRPDLLVADGLHKSPAGYAVMKKAIEPYLDESHKK